MSTKHIELVVYAQPLRDFRSPSSPQHPPLKQVITHSPKLTLTIHYPQRLAQVSYQAERLNPTRN